MKLTGKEKLQTDEDKQYAHAVLQGVELFNNFCQKEIQSSQPQNSENIGKEHDKGV